VLQAPVQELNSVMKLLEPCKQDEGWGTLSHRMVHGLNRSKSSTGSIQQAIGTTWRKSGPGQGKSRK